MKKRLSKIARDFKSNISIVVEFLRVNGYECEEDPEVEFSIEVKQIKKKPVIARKIPVSK